jgi:hypothetical protein
MKKSKWFTRPISRNCETFVDNHRQCGAPTTAAYPAYPSGWMALCSSHVIPHRGISTPIESLLRTGEQFATEESK